MTDFRKVELIYFNMHGGALPTRIMLRMAGIEFKDTQIKVTDWPEVKKEAST